MEQTGLFEPETAAKARERFEMLAPTAETVVKESARQMGFDSEEFAAYVTDDVIQTAHEALFASLLTVQIGQREAYEQWCRDHEYERVELGHENVDNVVWHAPPFADRLVAATFQEKREAAVGTLRRQAFARIYEEVLE